MRRLLFVGFAGCCGRSGTRARRGSGSAVVVDPHQRGCPGRFRSPPRGRRSAKIKELAVDARLDAQMRAAGVAAVREHRQPTDGGVVRLSAPTTGRSTSYAARRRQGVSRQAARVKQAREVYRQSCKNKDPALLEWLGAGMFKTSAASQPPGPSKVRTLAALPARPRLTDFVFLLSGPLQCAPPKSVKFKFRSTAGPDQNVHSHAHARHQRPSDQPPW